MQSGDKNNIDEAGNNISPLHPTHSRKITKSSKLDNVCYEIRGPVLSEAHRLEEEGHRVIKLNIGNPTPFGFEAPEEILRDVIHHLPESQGYADSKGLYSARKSVMQECQKQGFPRTDIDDIYLGNGVSELIVIAMQGLLNNGDEILVPAPDYPLWTAAITLAGGVPVHYICDESAGWAPDLNDIKKKTTNRTRGIVVINPNNPTGAVYEKNILKDIVKHGQEHDLILFADEIYSKIVFDDAQHVPLATLSDDILTVTFNGLSKAYRVPGFRSGWMVLSGAKDRAKDYIEGIDILSSMRLCANVPSQHAIQTALGGFQSIDEYVQPGGQLSEQRELAWSMLNQIEGISCVKPLGALYLFPKVDARRFGIHSDEKMVLDLLQQEKILVVQGTGFNYPTADHFRIVFLPKVEELRPAITRIGNFFEHYQQG